MADYDTAGASGDASQSGGNGYDRERSPLPERRGEDEFGRNSGGDGYDRDRERERSPDDRRRDRDDSPKRRPPPPPPGRGQEAPASSVLGCFGLSIRTRDIDLEDEFARYGRVEKAVIVYDQRSERSRGFGFVTMSSQDEAAKCIEKLNGIELHGRNIRVAYSMTHRPHASTPGEYMGFKTETRGGGGGGGGGFGGDRRRDDRYRRDDRGGRDDRDRGGRRERDYGRDDRDYRRRDDYDDRRRDDYSDRRRDDYDDRRRRDDSPPRRARDDSPPPRRRDDRDYDRPDVPMKTGTPARVD